VSNIKAKQLIFHWIQLLPFILLIFYTVINILFVVIIHHFIQASSSTTFACIGISSTATTMELVEEHSIMYEKLLEY
jgi:hypothetical protein